MVAWQRDRHAHTELAVPEVRTADLVARDLVVRGRSAKTGLGRTHAVRIPSRVDGPTIDLPGHEGHW